MIFLRPLVMAFLLLGVLMRVSASLCWPSVLYYALLFTMVHVKMNSDFLVFGFWELSKATCANIGTYQLYEGIGILMNYVDVYL